MPLVPPNLDTRTFEELVTEVRRRIPTATPEWTDLNESDPGITLAELFAFMSEQLLFQINQVPAKGLITFLKMVGAELHPATPAVADVTLIPLNPATNPTELTIDLSPATRVETSGPPPGEKNAIVFETARPITVLNGELVDLVSRDCNLEFISQKNANESPTEPFKPFGTADDTADQFYLVFQLSLPGATWPEGTFRLRVNLKDSKDVGEPPVDPTTPVADVEPRIRWAIATGTQTNLDGTKSLTFADFEGVEDSTHEFTRSGYLLLHFDDQTAPAFFRAPDETALEPEFFRGFFVLRAEVARPDAYENEGPPELNTIRLNTVPASAVQTVRNEFPGGSSGLPFQRFQLANAPVVPESTVVVIDESSEGGGATETWTETDDLFAADGNDRVYELFPATGEILFGDGVFGKIPPPDDGSSPNGNITVQSYQFGGGFAGNVGAGTLTNVTVIDPGVTTTFDATNVLPAAGGADEEPVALGVARAPAVVRSRFRAVTKTDFEALARETPLVRVARAFALANSRPSCGIGASPGSVTVILVPFARFEDSIHTPIPLPPHVAAAVLRYLDGRRLITTEVFTAPAVFRQVTVEARIQVEPRASVAATRAAVIAELERFFHALVGGDDGEGWPFGGTIFFSRVFERIVNVPGVARADEVLIGLEDGPRIECEDLRINRGELLFSGQHVVRASAAVLARGGA